MDSPTQVQTLSQAISISHSTNTVEKGMNSNILPPAMGKIVEQTGLFNLGMATSLEGKLNSNQTWIGMVSSGYSCLRHATWAATSWPNQVTTQVQIFLWLVFIINVFVNCLTPHICWNYFRFFNSTSTLLVYLNPKLSLWTAVILFNP